MKSLSNRKKRKIAEKAAFDALLAAASDHKLDYTYADKELIEGFYQGAPFQVNRVLKTVRYGSLNDKQLHRLNNQQLTIFFAVAENIISLANKRARLERRTN